MLKNENFNKLQKLCCKVKLLIAKHFSVPNRVRNKNQALACCLLLSNSKRAKMYGNWHDCCGENLYVVYY